RDDNILVVGLLPNKTLRQQPWTMDHGPTRGNKHSIFPNASPRYKPLAISHTPYTVRHPLYIFYFAAMSKAITTVRKEAKSIFDRLGTESLRRNILQAFPFWVASLATGLVAVAYTKLFVYSENTLLGLWAWKPWAVFIVTPVCFFFAWLVVQLFAPNAKGSGIPQVMAAVEFSKPRLGYQIDKLLSLRILVIKIISSLFMILGGGAIGREGPTIQIAGSIFRFINRITPASWPRVSAQSFILTGASAGLAAAFNTPLGGIVFAMEELSKIHIRFFRSALFSAVLIAGLTAQALIGPYLYLGYPDVKGLGFKIFAAVALTAVVAGVAGSLMSKLILAIAKWKKGFNTTKTVIFVILSGLLIAAAAYFLNDAVLGSGKRLMNTVLFTDDKYSSWDTMLSRILSPVVCFNTGAAGGIFAPSLAAGAAVGSFISQLFQVVGANANILALAGMVGFLTGVTRTPFTSAILVLEMTDRHSVIFHLMLAALLSNIVAVMIEKHSLYEQLKKNYVEEMVMKEGEDRR
ncbi:MAG TPA: chloride channel protein, partial [Chitinophagaceae bacterium]